MRFTAATAVVLAVAVLDPIWIVAQDAPCDAEPRYRVVTGVGSDTVREGQVDEFFKDADKGAFMLDRCDYARVEFSGPSHGDRPDLADVMQATIIVNRNRDTLTLYHVRESLHDICAVLADCADATK